MAKNKIGFDAAVFGRIEDILNGTSQVSAEEQIRTLKECRLMLRSLGQDAAGFKRNTVGGLGDALSRAHEVSKEGRPVRHTTQCFTDTLELANRVCRIGDQRPRGDDLSVLEKFCGSIRHYTADSPALAQ